MDQSSFHFVEILMRYRYQRTYVPGAVREKINKSLRSTGIIFFYGTSTGTGTVLVTTEPDTI